MRGRGSRASRAGVTLSEEGGMRYLHFGTEWVQGGMRLSRPDALALQYQQQMMAVALFVPEPGQVLQLGLGAAALTKFCYRQLPNARITAVDISREVIEAARTWFRLPADDARLTVIEADALAFVAKPKVRGSADWLQVDLYDAAAQGPVYDDAVFYRLCRASLRHPGVACFNLFGRKFDPSFKAIASAFDDRALVLPEADAGNRVVLAFAGPPLDVPFSAVIARARELESRWRLPLRRWAQGLREGNGIGERLRL